MNIIKCVIRGQRLNIAIPMMVDLTVNYFNIQASFSSEWDGMGIFAHIFKSEDPTTGGDFAVIDGTISSENGINLDNGEWNIWFSGTLEDNGEITQRITTETRKFNVLSTGTEDWSMPEIETSLAEQIMSVAAAAYNKAASVEERADAGEFDGEQGPQGIQGPQGPQGPAGPAGANGEDAKFDQIGATVGTNTGTPTVRVEYASDSTPQNVKMTFVFDGLKGERGEPGGGGGGGAYPPPGGVPYADLSEGVQHSLDKADTALQSVPDTYRTAAQQDLIDSEQDTAIAAKYTKPPLGIPASDMATVVQNSLSKANAAYNDETLTGASVTFDAESAGLPLKNVVVSVTPVQSGSGAPSPTNVRPISGWTGCTLSHSGEDTTQPGTLNIAFSTEAGTVYSGSLNVLTGVLTVDMLKVDIADLSWGQWTHETKGLFQSNIPSRAYSTQAKAICNKYNFWGSGYQSNMLNDLGDLQFGFQATNSFVWIRNDACTDVTSLLSASAGGYIVFDIAPVTYQLAPHEIATLLGENNIWADCGNVSVTYGAYLAAVNDHADRVNDELLTFMACIAPIENGATASQAYSQGAFFFHNGKFCKAKTAIASGATFTLDTNYEVTTVAAELVALS